MMPLSFFSTSLAPLLGTEAGPDASLWEQYVGLMTDPAHWLMELTLIVLFDILLGVLIWPPVKRVVIRRHDAKYAGLDHGTHGGTAGLSCYPGTVNFTGPPPETITVKLTAEENMLLQRLFHREQERIESAKVLEEAGLYRILGGRTPYADGEKIGRRSYPDMVGGPG